jgi:DNA modification methylase
MARILHADVRDMLKEIPDQSVDCLVSSPPYWRQRDYGVPGQIGLEATPDLNVDAIVAVLHAAKRVLKPRGTCWINGGDTYAV